MTYDKPCLRCTCQAVLCTALCIFIFHTQTILLFGRTFSYVLVSNNLTSPWTLLSKCRLHTLCEAWDAMFSNVIWVCYVLCNMFITRLMLRVCYPIISSIPSNLYEVTYITEGIKCIAVQSAKLSYNYNCTINVFPVKKSRYGNY